MPNTLGDQSSVTTDVLYETDGTVTTPSLPTTPFEEFVFVRALTGKVSINGAPGATIAVGGTLDANPSGWPSGSGFAYRWLRNGTAISGATASSYTVVGADAGQQLAV